MKLGQRLIIDCHIHPAFGRTTDLSWFGKAGSIEKQFRTLRRAGMTRVCGAPVLAAKVASFGALRRLNDRALRLRDRYPGFYVPGIQLHPHFPQESCREIERCCGHEGCRWIGELVGGRMGYGEDFATPDALVVMRQAAEHGAVVNIHCADLSVVGRLCRAVPGLKLVLAHPGTTPSDIQSRIAAVARFPNLHLDISGSGIDRHGCVRHLIDVAGSGKVLFGSDYHVNNPAVYVHGVLSEPLSESERTAVMSGNFLRLIGEGR
jgi:predicted TIM-barrel fold metal-dependent hydrolase